VVVFNLLQYNSYCRGNGVSTRDILEFDNKLSEQLKKLPDVYYFDNGIDDLLYTYDDLICRRLNKIYWKSKKENHKSIVEQINKRYSQDVRTIIIDVAKNINSDNKK
jgi:hypothetical protein